MGQPLHEPFARGDSPLHRADPRVKLILAALLSIELAVSHSEIVLLGGLALALVLVLVARIAGRRLLARLVLVNVFVALIWLIVPLTAGGEVAWSIGPLTFSASGIELARQITLRTNAIVIALIALLGTSTLAALTHALHHLYVPHKLVYLFYFTWRYAHVVAQEWNALRTAMKVRGFLPRTNLHTYRSYANLLGMLLVRSVDRSERVYRAMLCRGFDGTLPVLGHFAMRRADVCWIAGLSAFLVLFGWLEWINPIG